MVENWHVNPKIALIGLSQQWYDTVLLVPAEEGGYRMPVRLSISLSVSLSTRLSADPLFGMIFKLFSPTFSV